MKLKRFNESLDEENDKSIEEILSNYEVYNPKEFIKYLNENGYKITKIKNDMYNFDDDFSSVMGSHFSREY